MSATPEQTEAIKARGEVLVSASAGAGKTTVMIARLADVLEEGADLDNVLAVTFTKKAAAQMKEKLRRELIKRLETAEGARRENLRVQLGKVNTADISTIHSFCARLIRTYFYALKVDASFDVLTDGAEANALRANAMDDLFDKLYAERDSDFYLLLDKLRKKRSDKALKDLLSASYDGIRQYPDYLNKTRSACAFTYGEEGFKALSREYAECLALRFGQLYDAVVAFEADFAPPENGVGYFAVLDELRETLEGLTRIETPFNLPQKLYASVKPRVKPETAECDAQFASFCDGVKKRYRALIKDVSDEQTEREKLAGSGEVARAFFSVIARFDEVYSGVKREEGKLDYGDLEHLALELLRGESCDGDVRSAVCGKYAYVFVDEYQDVNPIQDEIISAVASRDIFCVGDLKQAIYGFRGSRSRFFAEKCGAVGDRGKYVVLPDNFRSAPNVISFVNGVFSGVMKPPFTDFDYADGHTMRGGSRYPDGFEGLAEICLFQREEGGKRRAEGVYSVSPSGEKCELTAEGSAVLSLVEEALKGEYYDPDLQKCVKVQAGDICVLTRKRGNANALGIVRALSTKYPVAGANDVNVCDRPEIIRLLNVLSYLDNAEQDIPLTASLLSPLGGFTEGELVGIRVYGGTGKGISFGACCKKYAREKTDRTALKLNAFFAEAERLRALARNVGASWLIDEIMKTDGFVSSFDTEEKLTALRRLQGEAFSSSGELYLSAFLQKVRAGGYKILAPASLASDSVKVMTMHASKGLEFPVVILADVCAEFTGDDREEMPYSEDFGFAPRYFDGQSRAYGNTLLRKLYKARAEREELSNEINLFYVACTRAKYALHVLASEVKEYDFLRAVFAKNYADLFDANAFTPRILSVERDLDGLSGSVERIVDDSRADENIYARLKETAEWVYPFATGADLPVKSSASRLISERGGAENAVKLFADEFERGGGSSADAGVAYHRFLELCDFSVRDKEGVENQLGKWLAEGKITPAQRDLLDVDELVKILAVSAFGGLDGYRLFREREFVCRLPSRDYRALKNGVGEGGFAVGGDDGNGVIVQGAIDLLAVKYSPDGRAVSAKIIDYKYSGRPDGYVREKYAPQLALYKSVVCRIYRLPESSVSTVILNIKARMQIDL